MPVVMEACCRNQSSWRESLEGALSGQHCVDLTKDDDSFDEGVQDLIGEPLRIALNAEDTSFHGMGREDIDVRCLGSGRPFVLEIKNPKIRETDLDKLVSAVNESADGKVEIDSLRWSKRGDVRKVKETRSEKTYTIRLKVDDIPDENTVVKSILSLSGVVLEQETPKKIGRAHV